ncbi:MAG: hypothetical protein ACI9XB_005247, partial [Gammaproteobacteria bacterium]
SAGISSQDFNCGLFAFIIFLFFLLSFFFLVTPTALRGVC